MQNMAQSSFESLLPVLMISGFVGVFALVIMLAIRQQKRARANLEKLATELGLTIFAPARKWFNSRPPEAGGTSRGRTTRIYSYTTGSGKSRVHWCALAVATQNPGKFTLRISRENFFTRAGRVFGKDDVATGDKAFDDQFYVKSSDPGYVRAALIPEVRAAVMAAWQDGARGSIVAEGSEVRYAEQGSFSSDKLCGRFPALVKLLGDVAEVVEARRG